MGLTGMGRGKILAPMQTSSTTHGSFKHPCHFYNQYFFVYHDAIRDIDGRQLLRVGQLLGVGQLLEVGHLLGLQVDSNRLLCYSMSAVLEMLPHYW